MTVRSTIDQDYTTHLHEWQQSMEARLRADDGWLTVVGLEWLHEGDNTIGSASDSTVALPDSAPAQLGVIRFQAGQAVLHANSETPVTVDGVTVTTAPLHDDTAEGGPTQVRVGAVTFFVIKRGTQYGVRIRDAESEARRSFTGRTWFAPDETYRVTGHFIPHAPGHTMQVETMIGTLEAHANPGRVAFDWQGQSYSLEAFQAGEEQLWFVFRDATSGVTTYGASRFLYAPLASDGTVILDFNRAYHPPCAFTPYATCPLPPRGNHLPIAIEAGERLAG